MTANQNQIVLCHKTETTPGTKIITGATDVTYLFGHFNEGQSIDAPKIIATKEDSDQSRPYNKREADNSTARLKPDKFQIPSFVPFDADMWRQFLGTLSAGTPNVLTAKGTGLKDAETIHLEHGGGTNPLLKDLVGAYLVELNWTMYADSMLVIAGATYEGMSVEWKQGDKNYYATSIPIELTTAPSYLVNSNAFFGCETTWDTGSYNTILNRVAMVDFSSSHDYVATQYNTTTKRRNVYPKSYKHKLTLHLVVDNDYLYEDLLAINRMSCKFKAYKANTSHYIEFAVSGLHILNVKESLKLEGGLLELTVECAYDSLTTNYVVA